MRPRSGPRRGHTGGLRTAAEFPPGRQGSPSGRSRERCRRPTSPARGAGRAGARAPEVTAATAARGGACILTTEPRTPGAAAEPRALARAASRWWSSPTLSPTAGSLPGRPHHHPRGRLCRHERGRPHRRNPSASRACERGRWTFGVGGIRRRDRRRRCLVLAGAGQPWRAGPAWVVRAGRR